MTYWLNNTGLTLGNITTESHTINSALEADQYPGSKTAEAEVFDTGMTIRKITLTGNFSASTQALLMDNFIVKVTAIHNGDQEPIQFHSDLIDASTTGDYTDGLFWVKVDSFNWRWVAGQVGRVDYTIDMTETASP